MRQPLKITGIVIAGGGLAGAAAATVLARAGVEVTVIERAPAPRHKICGEFLSVEAQHYLAQLGLDISSLGGHEITKLRLIRGDQEVVTPLPFRGIGISRFALDEALLHHSARCGAAVYRGHAVRGIDEDDSLSLNIDGLGTISAQTLFLATGKHEIRGRNRDVVKPGNFIGFKTYFRLAPDSVAALHGYINLLPFPGGYAGLQLVESGLANFCLLVERRKFQQTGNSWALLLEHLKSSCPYLKRLLDGAEEALPQPLAIYRIPYGFIHRPNGAASPRIFRLGDQAAVIHSFTGDGMSIALHSAVLAAQYYLGGRAALDYHRQLFSDLRSQINRAELLYGITNNVPAQAGLFGLARLFPQGLRMAANMTRVPARAQARQSIALKELL